MANQVSTTFSINATAALQQLAQYQQQLRNTIQLQTQLGNAGGAGTGAGGGGAAGTGAGALGGLGGTIAGAITFAAVAQGIKTVVSAAKEAQAANRALAASAVEAGKSYSNLAGASKAFADAALISESQAARSTAQLQRLVSLAGEGDQLEKYQKGFLDLAAARGVAFDELDTLFQGIIAGTDDALNRFGKQDPSKLAEQYARSLGKTVEQLTEQEKILSRLKAFDTDFGLFSGANEDRVRSFSGSVDRMNKSIDDIVTSFGKWATQSLVVADNLEAVRLAANFLSGSVDVGDVRARLAAGATPEQLARESVGSGPGVIDYSRAEFSKLARYTQGVLTLGLMPYSERLDGMTGREMFDQRYQRVLAMFSAEQRTQERDDQIAAQRGNELRAKQIMDQWQAERKAVADAAKAERDRLEGLRKRIGDVRDLLGSIASQDNPFVRIFEDAAKAIERVRGLAQGLGGQLGAQALGAVRQQGLSSLFGQRIDTALAAGDFRFNAEILRNGIDWLTSPTEEQIAAERRLRSQIDVLQGVDVRGLNSQTAERIRNRRLAQLFSGVDADGLSADLRTLAANVFEREATSLESEESAAMRTFDLLNGLVQNGALGVSVKAGESLVRIVNEAPDSATVTTRPSQSATNGRYSN